MPMTEFSQSFLEHVVRATSQYDDTCRGLAKEVLQLRKANDRAALLLGGGWSPHDPRRFFVDGAKWWQFTANGATAFPSEVDAMEAEATRRYGERTEQIARTIHAVIHGMDTAMGRTQQVAWDQADEQERAMYIGGVELVLATSRITPKRIHDYWWTWMEGMGWSYGAVKDRQLKEHPCMVPFDALDTYQQGKDALFIAMVRALSA